MTEKLSIFDVLNDVSNKKRDFYSSLSEAEQKTLQPLVLSKWLVGTSDPLQIMLLNQFVNPYIFKLHQHKELLMQLLTVTSPGKSRRYKWLKRAKSSTSKFPTIVGVIKQEYGYNTKDANDVIPLLSDDDILEMAVNYGLQTDQLKLLKKELKARVK